MLKMKNLLDRLKTGNGNPDIKLDASDNLKRKSTLSSKIHKVKKVLGVSKSPRKVRFHPVVDRDEGER